MANFLHTTDLGSDTDDEDYVPEEPAEAPSEEEDDGVPEEGDGSARSRPQKKKKPPRQPPGGATRKRGGLFAQDEAEQRAEADRQREFVQEKQEIQQEVEKKKIDDLWADFKKDANTKPKVKQSTGSGLGALASTGTKPRSSLSSIFDSKPKESPSSPNGNPSGSSSRPKSLLSSIFDKKEETPNVADVKAEAEESSKEAKLKITRVFDFAGESVAVTKEVEKDSKEGKQFLKDRDSEGTPSSAAQPVKRPAGVGGLASIMNEISGKKKKIGCLDKSKLDWDSFVNKEGIREDLTTHNRGKEGFVDKQEFLERADVRRFELEKTAREKTRKTLNR